MSYTVRWWIGAVVTGLTIFLGAVLASAQAGLPLGLSDVMTAWMLVTMTTLTGIGRLFPPVQQTPGGEAKRRAKMAREMSGSDD